MAEALTPQLTLHQTVFALAISLLTFLFILELVRRRRLREEYAWLWLLTAGAMILLVVWFRLLVLITHLVGAVTPLNTLLLFAVLFLFAIAVHYSVIVSRLTTQVKNLAQELALISAQLEDRRR
jgi:hypothetical protein